VSCFSQEYNEEALMLLDREELAQWLTYRNVPFPPAMTLNELRAVAKDKIADPRKLKPKLYRDWGAAWSVEYERWYYINKLTSVTTWEAPSGPATDADGKIRKWAGITLSNPVIPEKKVRHDKSARRDKSTGSGGAQDEHSLAAEEESEGPISINAASLQRLAKALSMDMAEKIVTERKTRLFASSQDAGALPLLQCVRFGTFLTLSYVRAGCRVACKSARQNENGCTCAAHDHFSDGKKQEGTPSSFF
jgi:hypothetical protein